MTIDDRIAEVIERDGDSMSYKPVAVSVPVTCQWCGNIALCSPSKGVWCWYCSKYRKDK